MKINSKKVALANLDKFNLKQYLYDADGLIVNDHLEKVLKKAILTVLADDLVGLWKYPQTTVSAGQQAHERNQAKAEAK